MHSGNTIIYNSTIKATNENLDEAMKKFNQAKKAAPTPDAYPDKNVVVAHTFEYADTSITVDENTNIGELLKKFGITQANPEATVSTKANTELANTDAATLRFKI